MGSEMCIRDRDDEGAMVRQFGKMKGLGETIRIKLLVFVHRVSYTRRKEKSLI